MHFDEDSEINEDGCCDVLLIKIRRRKRVVLLSLLMIAVVGAVVTGLYSGITLKEYSTLAIAVGIFFPSVVLLFICIYIAFSCGQESVYKNPSRVRHSRNRRLSSHCEDVERPQKTNSISQLNLRARNLAKCDRNYVVDDEFLEVGDENTNQSIRFGERGIPLGSCNSRRRLRSLSNSDATRYLYRSNKIHHDKSDILRENGGKAGNNCNLRHRKRQDVPRTKRFRRSISDTAYKYRKADTGKMPHRNKPLVMPRNPIKRQNALENGKPTVNEYYSDPFEQPPTVFYRKNSESYDDEIEFDGYIDEMKSCKNKGIYAAKYSLENIGCEHWTDSLPNSEVEVFQPSTSTEYSYERGKYSDNSGPRSDGSEFLRSSKSSIDDCSIKNADKNGISYRSSLQRNGSKSYYISAEEKMEVAGHLKRKTIYVPTSGNNEPALSIPRHVADYVNYIPRVNKIAHRPPPGNKENIEANIHDPRGCTSKVQVHSVGCLATNYEINAKKKKHSNLNCQPRRKELAARQNF